MSSRMPGVYNSEDKIPSGNLKIPPWSLEKVPLVQWQFMKITIVDDHALLLRMASPKYTFYMTFTVKVKRTNLSPESHLFFTMFSIHCLLRSVISEVLSFQNHLIFELLHNN
ncbi:hypothetical protein T01_12001 [Trichinella spiralis]|uniref:Uncharacterized protein n=1 Tax=Trichinella spiralis TaxID=6334 RepID=A0A0V1BZY1_TRISP|nr:hypothetical protein T01_12001 [Trichinella spiralis]